MVKRVEKTPVMELVVTTQKTMTKEQTEAFEHWLLSHKKAAEYYSLDAEILLLGRLPEVLSSTIDNVRDFADDQKMPLGLAKAIIAGAQMCTDNMIEVLKLALDERMGILKNLNAEMRKDLKWLPEVVIEERKEKKK
jgi:hypothetical protein